MLVMLVMLWGCEEDCKEGFGKANDGLCYPIGGTTEPSDTDADTDTDAEATNLRFSQFFFSVFRLGPKSAEWIFLLAVPLPLSEAIS